MVEENSRHVIMKNTLRVHW